MGALAAVVAEAAAIAEVTHPGRLALRQREEPQCPVLLLQPVPLLPQPPKRLQPQGVVRRQRTQPPQPDAASVLSGPKVL